MQHLTDIPEVQTRGKGTRRHREATRAEGGRWGPPASPSSADVGLGSHTSSNKAQDTHRAHPINMRVGGENEVEKARQARALLSFSLLSSSMASGV